MALMFAGVQSPEAFDELGYWSSHYLGKALAEREKNRVDLQVALAGGKPA